MKSLPFSGSLMALTVAISAISGYSATLNAKFETKGYFDDDGDNNASADDPAIWVHPTHKSKSLVLGTLKEGGLVVFDLEGNELQRILPVPGPDPEEDRPGRYNNVDLLLGFPVKGRPADVAVVSDRGFDILRMFRINPHWSQRTPPVTEITAPGVPRIFNVDQEGVNSEMTAYGLATHYFEDRTGGIGFVTQAGRGRVAKVEFASAPGGKVTYAVTGSFGFPSEFTLPDGELWGPCLEEPGEDAQFEGLVIDAEARKVYLGQELVGVWRMNLDGSKRKLIEKVRTFGWEYEREFDPEEEEFGCEYTVDRGHGGNHLSADVEGLTVFKAPHGNKHYLLASSQGDNSFSIWDVKGWDFEGTFSLQIDGDLNEDSDGAHVVIANLGRHYPMGLLVTQDGDNTPEVPDDEGEPRDQSNFKFTPFDRILKALGLRF